MYKLSCYVYTAINLFYGTLKYNVTKKSCADLEVLITKEHMLTNTNIILAAFQGINDPAPK